MAKETLYEQWIGYVASGVPKDISVAELERLRRAFYGGAVSLFALLMAKPDEPLDVSTEVDLRLVQRLNAELQEHGRQVAQDAEREARGT